MRLEIVGKNYVVADRLQEVIEQKLDKLDKYFVDDVFTRVVCREEGRGRHIMEITIKVGSRILRAEVSSDNMYDNIDLALPKLERQIRKYRTKLDKQIKMTSQDVVEESEVQRIVRSKQFEVVPMTVDEAMLQIELLGHEFFVFLNVDNNRINVVYKRREGDYGILDPIY
ncbi:MAG: ribosome-associated translation inhibitor RaiA [Clostridia bacterium]|nr:ribosome-associated translation inhibitor RaiA [Clostridia bacterium]